jgi:hypothetical protein
MAQKVPKWKMQPFVASFGLLVLPQNGCFGSSYVTGRSCTPNSAVNIPSDLLS